MMSDDRKCSGEPSRSACASSPSRMLHSWLELIRVPNLLTVPGDPLAGFLLAGGKGGEGACVLAMASAMCFYVLGLITNDLRDLAEDAEKRPQRPLPSGRVPLLQARLTAWLLGCGGLICAAFAGGMVPISAVVLLALVLIYNRWTKGRRGIGPLTMGLCRGMSVLLGAAAGAGSSGVLSGALVLAATTVVYIAVVTAIAAGETGTQQLGQRRLLPLVTLGVGGFAFWRVLAGFSINPIAVVPFLGAIAVCMLVARALRGSVAPTICQRCIGKLIGVLILMQAAAAAATVEGCGGVVLAVGGGGLWWAFTRLGRWFYSS